MKESIESATNLKAKNPAERVKKLTIRSSRKVRAEIMANESSRINQLVVHGLRPSDVTAVLEGTRVTGAVWRFVLGGKEIDKHNSPEFIPNGFACFWCHPNGAPRRMRWYSWMEVDVAVKYLIDCGYQASKIDLKNRE